MVHDSQRITDVALTAVQGAECESPSFTWRARLPVLRGRQVILREPRPSDAESLHHLLTTSEVCRFIHEPPSSVEAFERFIAWTDQQRVSGEGACFVITVPGFDAAVGIIQLRKTGASFGLADWGVVLASAFWGTGVFEESARLLLDFAFNTVGVQRLEATTVVENVRANAAIRKLGAVPEGTLPGSFVRNGEAFDQVLYVLRPEDYRALRLSASALAAGAVH